MGVDSLKTQFWIGKKEGLLQRKPPLAIQRSNLDQAAASLNVLR